MSREIRTLEYWVSIEVEMARGVLLSVIRHKYGNDKETPDLEKINLVSLLLDLDDAEQLLKKNEKETEEEFLRSNAEVIDEIDQRMGELIEETRQIAEEALTETTSETERCRQN